MSAHSFHGIDNVVLAPAALQMPEGEPKGLGQFVIRGASWAPLSDTAVSEHKAF